MLEVFQVAHQSYSLPWFPYTISLLRFESTAIGVNVRNGSKNTQFVIISKGTLMLVANVLFHDTRLPSISINRKCPTHWQQRRDNKEMAN